MQQLPPIAIIKVSNAEDVKKYAGVAEQLAKTISGHCFVIPLDVDIVMGEMALEDLGRFHVKIHKALGITGDDTANH